MIIESYLYLDMILQNLVIGFWRVWEQKLKWTKLKIVMCASVVKLAQELEFDLNKNHREMDAKWSFEQKIKSTKFPQRNENVTLLKHSKNVKFRWLKNLIIEPYLIFKCDFNTIYGEK